LVEKTKLDQNLIFQVLVDGLSFGLKTLTLIACGGADAVCTGLWRGNRYTGGAKVEDPVLHSLLLSVERKGVNLLNLNEDIKSLWR
jgi:hypothetical protein